MKLIMQYIDGIIYSEEDSSPELIEAIKGSGIFSAPFCQ